MIAYENALKKHIINFWREIETGPEFPFFILYTTITASHCSRKLSRTNPNEQKIYWYNFSSFFSLVSFYILSSLGKLFKVDKTENYTYTFCCLLIDFCPFKYLLFIKSKSFFFDFCLNNDLFSAHLVWVDLIWEFGRLSVHLRCFFV